MQQAEFIILMWNWSCAFIRTRRKSKKLRNITRTIEMEIIFFVYLFNHRKKRATSRFASPTTPNSRQPVESSLRRWASPKRCWRPTCRKWKLSGVKSKSTLTCDGKNTKEPCKKSARPSFPLGTLAKAHSSLACPIPCPKRPPPKKIIVRFKKNYNRPYRFLLVRPRRRSITFVPVGRPKRRLRIWKNPWFKDSRLFHRRRNFLFQTQLINIGAQTIDTDFQIVENSHVRVNQYVADMSLSVVHWQSQENMRNAILKQKIISDNSGNHFFLLLQFCKAPPIKSNRRITTP